MITNSYRSIEGNFYTVQSIADKLKVSPSAVYRYIKALRLKPIRLGNQYLLNKEAVDRIIRHTKGVGVRIKRRKRKK